MKKIILDKDLSALMNNYRLQTALALVPNLLFILTVISYFAIYYSLFNYIGEKKAIETSTSLINSLLGNLFIFMILAFFSFFTGVISFIYYIFHVVKNPQLHQQDQRLLWIVGVVFGMGLGTLIYWWAQIKKKNPRPMIDLFAEEY
ncbi:hypothetical protein ACF3NR_08885 [Vaginella massiliensis]|uniref:hypothetical protein n=1 Tax=Vaginella massiliensis TaxID=1816680 RepID=UPI0037511DDF